MIGQDATRANILARSLGAMVLVAVGVCLQGCQCEGDPGMCCEEEGKAFCKFGYQVRTSYKEGEGECPKDHYRCCDSGQKECSSPNRPQQKVIINDMDASIAEGWYKSACIVTNSSSVNGKRQLGASLLGAATFGKWIAGAVGGSVVGWSIEYFLDTVFSSDWVGPLSGDGSTVSELLGACAPYPKSHVANWCSKQAKHAHRVPTVLGDDNLAAHRDSEAELLWQKFITNSATQQMREIMNSHPICKYSIIDGLCLDAFPGCCAEMTACRLVCRNVALCAHEVHGTQYNASCIQKECSEKCEIIHGLYHESGCP